ncbi:toxin-antitoxin system YwqK family antitoxin [Flavobacterium sp. RSB2_4_14]|uniref:toxin-antitoxin system YwqK family antitoxin n=1 Tax=Flavobacterium sp. RSB2_4_14 TaxID=3447665 RepID=UPI003F3F4C3D
MKYLIVLLFTSFSLLAQDFNKFDSDGKKHGLWKGFYEESKRQRYEGTFDHGKEIGLFKFFDDTKAGTIIATRDFNKTDNSCYTIFYNQNKNKVSEGKVVNKQFEGEWKFYHEDSPAIMTTEHYKIGKLTGVRKVFYKSGKIAEETTYKDGIKNGGYKKYAENDVVLEETIYVNGEYDGLAIFRNPDNQITGQGNFKNGKKVGMWKLLEKGKLINVNMDKQGKKFQKRVKPLEE